ncbi:hypothetical protein O6H91_09G062200 [Diphasiastrum complanatum]|uniref:Uncharacterized protein n=1 Tax=Diphasiastrum complanatum TaxID=34168 RepID=A0ACC2CPX7_DIPCM|nr:hypothetical protein O6H91_09G062200 [Diphasiastrum complanatum]
MDFRDAVYDPCMYELSGFVEVVLSADHLSADKDLQEKLGVCLEVKGEVETTTGGIGRNGHEELQASPGNKNTIISSTLKFCANAKCRVSGEWADVHVLVETGASLYLITDTCEEACHGSVKDAIKQQSDFCSKDHGRFEGESMTLAIGASQNEFVNSPIPSENARLKDVDPCPGSGDKSLRGTPSGKKSSGIRSIVHELHRLSVQNDVKVVGRIIRVLKQGDKIRVVALLDVYLPSSLWSDHNYWKAGKVAIAALTHLSCDWNRRARILQTHSSKVERDAVEDSSAWKVGYCHVLGCKMHERLSKSEMNAKFNLHKIFKSLPTLNKTQSSFGTCIQPRDANSNRGLHDLNDDVLIMIFSKLSPKDLHSITSTCRHTRMLCCEIIPNLNLKLFPHQQAAVAWMLQREQNPQKFKNPIVKELQTADGFQLYLNSITGDLTPDIPTEVVDFRGGLFCDEPGLGKTVTALALILKTQGRFSQPPPGIEVRWSESYFNDKLGYYELATTRRSNRVSHKADEPSVVSVEDSFDYDAQPPDSLIGVSASHDMKVLPSVDSSSYALNLPDKSINDESFGVKRCFTGTKRKLFDSSGDYEGDLEQDDLLKVKNQGLAFSKKKRPSHVLGSEEPGLLYDDGASLPPVAGQGILFEPSKSLVIEESWLQCDHCKKWRKFPLGQTLPDEETTWLCTMNKDPIYNRCSSSEEKWNRNHRICYLQGYRKSGSAGGVKQNVMFFINVLKEHVHCLDDQAKKVLSWLANLTSDQLTKMSGEGIALPRELRHFSISNLDHYKTIFEAFGLVQRSLETKAPKWCYPKGLYELVFDLDALKTALAHPLGGFTRIYLSKATLVVVPSNLVKHWKDQIRKHTKLDQSRVYIWNDKKERPPPHDLAWDHDIVITTFSRLSVEWGLKENSPLMQVHWLRIILDEGHTLGASVSLTNKLQMAISMHSSYRWILTGTPMPNTPNSQLAHLHPMLKFLHENLYGQNLRWWDSGILRPFEAGHEDGRDRLLQLLKRSMISSRKSHMRNIPPCIRNVKLLDFTAKHAASYNELVTTVRRNILLADWNDPDHIESLLNSKQWKSRSNTLRNVRLSCCVAGHIRMRDVGKDVQETLDILVQQGVERYSNDYRELERALFCGSSCNRCSEWCRLPILTPCKHFLCLSCVALDSTKCTSPDCGLAYKMQNPAARPENPNPKWPVPQDLIELQPSYAQEDWHADWKATASSKVAYLVEQLKLLQGATIENPHLNNCMEKVIVFSQFLEHIEVIKEQLTAADIQHVGLYSPLISCKKMESLVTFQNSPDCMVLIMDGSAALGLDLSFVTHVYLMEPIWDRSMEEQVISRAHRMGATRPVYVETLAMRSTVEEQMLLLLEVLV